MTRSFRGLQRVTGGYKELLRVQGVTSGDITGVTGVSKG